MSGHVIIEFSHRLFASLVSILVIAILIVAWRSYRRAPVVMWGAALSFGLIVAQVVLGGITVLSDLHSGMVMAHLATASALLATLLVLTIVSFEPRPGSAANVASFRNIAAIAAVAMLALMMTGSYVSGSGAGLAFRDWPLFNHKLMPDGGRLAMIQATHRFAALGVGLLLAHVAGKAWRTQRANTALLAGTTLALTLYVAQIFVGAANIWTLLQPAASAAHLAVAMAIWATLVAVAALAHLSTLEGRPAIEIEAAPEARRPVAPAPAPAGGPS
jgi:heme A synthase